MARRAHLTPGELRVMTVLWERGEATVTDVVTALNNKLARNTVQTVLGLLERKGMTAHRTEGRTFVYRPKIEQQVAQRSALNDLLKRFFDSSPSLLVSALLEGRAVSEHERAKIREIVDTIEDGE